MRGPGADERRARGVDAVCARERERQARKRRPAPAGRRAAGVRAERGLHRARRPRSRGGRRPPRAPRGAVRAPVEDQVRRASDRPARARAPNLAGSRRRPRRRRLHALPRDGARTKGTRSTPASPRRPTAARARGARASGRSARAGRAPVPAAQLLGGGSEPRRSSSRSTRFTCAWASGVSSQTQRVGTPCRLAVSIT